MKKTQKYIAVVLTGILLTLAMVNSVSALLYHQTNATGLLNNEFTPRMTTGELQVEPQSDIPERVYDEEVGLNTIVLDNGNGTHSMLVYEHDVKYTDQNGVVRDKNNTLVLCDDGNYKNVYNNIQTTFPQNLYDGISLDYGDYTITMVPIRLFHDEVAGVRVNEYSDHGESEVSAEAIDVGLSSVLFSNVFSKSIDARYYATFNGFKEDIILRKYEGISEFQFSLRTNGIQLITIGDSIYLFDPDIQTIIGNLGEIIISDSVGNASIGQIEYEIVREGQEYLLTIIAPEDYLTDATVVYPITIDPSFNITVDSSSNKAIVDAPVYSGMPRLAAGASYKNNVGYMSTTSYGYARSLTKFPGLFENLTELNITADEIISVNYNAYCVTKGNAASCLIYLYEYKGATWNESTVTYNNSGMDNEGVTSSLTNPLSSVYVTATGEVYHFDITKYAHVVK